MSIYNGNDFDDVGKFHQKFDLDNVTYNKPGPRPVDPELIEFRRKFMQEELDEFIEAYANGDIEKMADSLVDLSYVVLGTAHLLGLPWPQLFREVQRANMTKVRAKHADESKRGSTFDVVKPEGWRPPKIREVLVQFGWELP
jgi:predicted HAD superfamily Cof-like phosphohydrolase